MPPSGSYGLSGNITLGIWRWNNGWVKVTQVTTYIDQTVAGAGSRTVSWSDAWNVTLGSGVQYVGISVDSYSGTNATVSYLAYQFAQQASGGERSATPNGEVSSVVVTPQ